jgi:hypothetical protein
MILTPLQPPTFNEQLAAGTRAVYGSERIRPQFFVHEIRYAFRDGALDTLKLRFWISDQVNPVAGDVIGESFLAGYGTRDFVSGEGPEVRVLPINKQYRGGLRLFVDADNTDSFLHTVDVMYIVSEVGE